MPHISDPLLQAYIDGFCNDARVTQIEAHLDACHECRDRLDEARHTAARASQLLGALDPGPVHAPSFEELQERAAARAAAGEATAGARGEAASAARDEVDRVAALTPSTSRVSLWRRPALAWAATVVIAFGVGWMSRTELGLPADLRAPAGPSFENALAELSSEDEADDAAVRQQERVAPGKTADKPDEAQASQRELVVGDEIDDLQAAAKRSVSSELVPQSAPAPPAPTEPQAKVQRDVTAQISGAPATAGERRVVEEEVAATISVRQNTPAEGALRFAESNEQLGRTYAFGDIGVADGFLEVDRESARLWLGVAPRELPDLALLRAEVGPGVLFDNGLPGRPVVRLVYLARSGQEISLLQQYTGPLGTPGLLEDAEQAQLNAPATPADQRADAAAAPARAERGRVSGLGAARNVVADRDAAADRDALSVGGTLDLPVTERRPDGTNVYRWMDGAGYLLSISGAIEPEFLRGLADVIR